MRAAIMFCLVSISLVASLVAQAEDIKYTRAYVRDRINIAFFQAYDLSQRGLLQQINARESQIAHEKGLSNTWIEGKVSEKSICLAIGGIHQSLAGVSNIVHYKIFQDAAQLTKSELEKLDAVYSADDELTKFCAVEYQGDKNPKFNYDNVKKAAISFGNAAQSSWSENEGIIAK